MKDLLKEIKLNIIEWGQHLFCVVWGIFMLSIYIGAVCAFIIPFWLIADWLFN